MQASFCPSCSSGKERNQESGNDYFGARYYTSNIGHWISPDWSAKVEPVPYSKLDDPQTLNLYAYVGNNPISGVDPDGHAPPDPDCSGREDMNKCNKETKQNSTCPDFCAPAQAQQQINTDPPPPPPPPPAAVLRTSINGGYTEFMWTDKNGKFHDDKINSLVKVDHRSKAGAADPFKSDVVGQIHGLSSPAYGPEGAQINTGDSRGRWIHGGGSSLADPYAPNQKLTPTFGCTRACNIDVQRMAGEITNFQNANPGTPIPYSRS